MFEIRFRENLRDQLNYLGMTVQELADGSGISKRTIENYLSARGSIPPADYACRMASVLGVTVEWLVTGETMLPTRENTKINRTRKLVQEINSLPEKISQAIETLIENYGDL